MGVSDKLGNILLLNFTRRFQVTYSYGGGGVFCVIFVVVIVGVFMCMHVCVCVLFGGWNVQCTMLYCIAYICVHNLFVKCHDFIIWNWSAYSKISNKNNNVHQQIAREHLQFVQVQSNICCCIFSIYCFYLFLSVEKARCG